MINARKWIGQIVGIASGICLFRLCMAAYKGSHDAQVALLTLAGAAIVLGITLWGFMGDDA